VKTPLANAGGFFLFIPGLLSVDGCQNPGLAAQRLTTDN
jgi:hypothetical protein